MTTNQQHTTRRRRPSARKARRATAMMVALFTLVVTAGIVVSVLDTETIQYTSVRNTVEYERALYLAGAGVHHALAEIEADFSWRTGISSTEYPASSGNTYSATAADGDPGEVVVVGTGTAGGVTRKLQVTVKKSS